MSTVDPVTVALRSPALLAEGNVHTRGRAFGDRLQPADCSVEKPTHSGFYMPRPEWCRRNYAVGRRLFCGIFTSGGVTSTVQEAHVRDLNTITPENGCAATSQAPHKSSTDTLRSVGKVKQIAGIPAIKAN